MSQPSRPRGPCAGPGLKPELQNRKQERGRPGAAARSPAFIFCTTWCCSLPCPAATALLLSAGTKPHGREIAAAAGRAQARPPHSPGGLRGETRRQGGHGVGSCWTRRLASRGSHLHQNSVWGWKEGELRGVTKGGACAPRRAPTGVPQGWERAVGIAPWHHPGGLRLVGGPGSSVRLAGGGNPAEMGSEAGCTPPVAPQHPWAASPMCVQHPGTGWGAHGEGGCSAPGHAVGAGGAVPVLGAPLPAPGIGAEPFSWLMKFGVLCHRPVPTARGPAASPEPWGALASPPHPSCSRCCRCCCG